MDTTPKAMPLLNSLVGQKVMIFTGGGAQDFKDTGMLDAFDDHWVRLRDDKAKHLYFSITQIRLIKPV